MTGQARGPGGQEWDRCRHSHRNRCRDTSRVMHVTNRALGVAGLTPSTVTSMIDMLQARHKIIVKCICLQIKGLKYDTPIKWGRKKCIIKYLVLSLMAKYYILEFFQNIECA